MRWILLTLFTCIFLMAAVSIPAMKNTLSSPVTWNTMLSRDYFRFKGDLEH